MALAAIAPHVEFATSVEAKTPGETYCYYGVCHRVMTIEETQSKVGVVESIMASHYDDCKKDSYNPCGLTSSGERFHPDRPDNAASPIYPDGTMLLVWSPETERALVIRVNNAGPYWGDRKLDLSRAAAEKLGFDGKGVAAVQVRVIKAPQPEEATYVANRNYPPVPGDIGEYDSLQEAQSGMAVAMALQASAASPLAPVTTANAFTRREAREELLVAEAPQSLGRVPARVAAARPPPRVDPTAGLGALLAQSLKPLRPAAPQSQPQVASLSVEHEPKQSIWGEDVIEPATSPIVTGSIEVAVATEIAPEETIVAKEPPAKEKRVAQPKKQEKKKVASRSRSRKSQARKERRVSRTAYAERRYERDRYESRERRAEPSRSAGQLMSLNIRARSASTM